MAAGLLQAASTSRAELTGRFFLATQERATLDALRNTGIAPGARSGGGPITVNSLVSRSSGKHTIWINGKPLNENEATNSVTILHKQPAGGKVTVRLPGSTQSVGMRVGQTLDRATGKVREVYDPPQNKEAAEEDIE
jgi:hypothetical protein